MVGCAYEVSRSVLGVAEIRVYRGFGFEWLQSGRGPLSTAAPPTRQLPLPPECLELGDEGIRVEGIRV